MSAEALAPHVGLVFVGYDVAATGELVLSFRAHGSRVHRYVAVVEDEGRLCAFPVREGAPLLVGIAAARQAAERGVA